MAGFMSGFGTTLAALIEEDRKYYRDAAAKRRDYIQTYGTRAVAERESKANAAKGVFNYLISNDISEEDARYVLNTSGVQGLAQLKATIDSRTDLTADERSKLVKKAKDYVDENPDEDINSVLKRAYGLYKSTDNPVKRERSMFASMLGLDSRMMEDEVLDDLYINGYTGRDIYRIMGSAEAQTGTALDLDLPSKPPSPTVLNNTAKFLESQFDTSIDSRISSIEQQMLTVDKDGTDYKDLNDERTKLENLKAKGLLALGQYAAAYDPALFDFARAQEEALPGSITRNSYLFEFLPAYQTHFEEGQDEAKVAAAGDKTSEALGTTPGAGAGDGTGATPELSNKVMEFATTDEFNKAAAAGEIPSGAAVQIGDGQVQTFNIPDEEPKTVDLGDMSGAPGFRERDDIPEPSDFIEKAASRKYGREGDIAGYKAMYDTVMALPEDDRSSYVEAFESIEDMPEVTEVIQEVTKDIPGFVDNVVGKGAGAVGMGGLLFYKGMAYADAFITGDKARVAEGLIKADKAMERAKEVFSEGIVQYLQEKADEAGMQGGFSKARGEKLKKALAKDTNVIAAIDSRLQDAGDVWRSGDVFASGGGQVEAESDPAVLSGVFDTKDGVPSRTDIDNLKTVLELNQVTLPEKVTKEDVAEEAKIDEIIVANLDTSQDITRQDFDKIKTILEQEQLIDTSTDELYRGPISGKTLVEKLDDIYNFYTQEDTEYNPRAIGTVGSRDLGLRDTTDDVRPPRNREPDAQTRTRAPLGDTRTEPDATVPSISAVSRGDRPSGLMSPNKDTRKVNVGDLATFADPELMSNIKRLHGSGSKLFKDFDNKISSGTMKPADISRLIKATRKLPNTKSKDKLLNSLFDLRDALNNR
jgi:hypothetical protein